MGLGDAVPTPRPERGGYHPILSIVLRYAMHRAPVSGRLCASYRADDGGTYAHPYGTGHSPDPAGLVVPAVARPAAPVDALSLGRGTGRQCQWSLAAAGAVHRRGCGHGHTCLNGQTGWPRMPTKPPTRPHPTTIWSSARWSSRHSCCASSWTGGRRIG